MENPALPTRRHFLRKTAASGFVALAGTAAYTWRIEPHWVEVVRRDLPIAHLPSALAGRTLVQLSDLHVGPEVDDDYLIRNLKYVSDLNADIHVLTGDFMTCRLDEQVDHAVRVLSHLRPARLATLAVLGNHDYARSFNNAAVADVLAKRLDDLGIDLLRNCSHDVQGLTIVGLDDLWSGCFAPEQVLPSLRPGQASLVLCHNPDAVDKGKWHGYRGWILSGHTHGGQCKPPFLPPPLLPVRNPRYVAGEVDLHDGRRLYINRGLGHLRRVRFNVRPEITVFTLVSQSLA
ncbi:MAG TPA: metallophosphoesterase [Nitrospira sp.]|nr:metallophosphoesterase [Nitrospira sp.]